MRTAYGLRTLGWLAASVSLAAFGCDASSRKSAISPPPASAMVPSTGALQEVHVDGDCGIRQDVAGPAAVYRKDQEICRLVSVFTTNHVEKVMDGQIAHRSSVDIAEQEYLLQNVTRSPVVFVVAYPLSAGWRIDSDPPPMTLSGETAIFRVVAQPQEIVRLHVGKRHAVPLDSAASLAQTGW